MKLYERIENNNFDEIDRNRAIELIEGENGHLVYNENYFKLQKENEELKRENEELKVLEDDIQEKRIAYIDEPEFEEKYMPKQKIKDKQIDKLKKHNDELLRKLRNRVKEVKKLEKYSLYKEEFSRLNKQLQNKEKIIDLMTEYISNITDCPFESEKKYLDCEKMCDVRTDKECWKEYFENKAKE